MVRPTAATGTLERSEVLNVCAKVNPALISEKPINDLQIWLIMMVFE